MRRSWLLSALVLACTEPETGDVLAAEPFWTEWPAEVRAAEPFGIRIVVWGPGCYEYQQLRVQVTTSQSAVTLRSEFFVQGDNNNAVCLRDPAPYDTTIALAGLPSAGTTAVRIVPGDRGAAVTHGVIVVRAAEPVNRDRTRGAGSVTGATDIEGCPVMIRAFEAPIPVENPPAETWMGFVRGYFFTPAVPLCGQTRAFHVDEVL